MSNWKSGVVELATGHMAYHRTGGNLPPLVLAHGLTDNGLCWTRVAQQLAPDLDVIMLDSRGHGRSARVNPETQDNPAADIKGVIEALGLQQPAVMGHSMGARAMAMLANEYPALVSRVILEDPPFMPSVSSGDRDKQVARFRKQVEGFGAMSQDEIIAFGRKLSPDWHDDEFDAWSASKQQVDPNVMAHFNFQPWQEAIHHITAPTLLIFGDPEQGGIVSQAVAQEAHAINPVIRPVHIPGAGHNIRREQFQQFVAVVRAFLAES